MDCMSVMEVADWLRSRSFSEEIIDCFIGEETSGVCVCVRTCVNYDYYE